MPKESLYDSMVNEVDIFTELLMEDFECEFLFEITIRNLKALVPDLSREEVEDLQRRFLKYSSRNEGYYYEKAQHRKNK